ncbi:thiamine pyrophosphate-requiring protein [Roseixanthobacter pseudopolyaromaticivorans]|uniref:thiamine pyrophosphate-requiring protein n=1 Tax=Xanthobacteraceae TaxID=335928 RepID=UPI0037279CDE
MPTVAEWFLRGLALHDVDAIFINPGTDTPALQEAYASLTHQQVKLPKLITCPHEVIASAAAQGAYLTTGRAQVALVHVDVGTANAAGALNDARASQIPVLLCAGMSPSALDSSVPGGRSKFINWHQDVPDQHALVRNYTKWTQTVSVPAAIGPAVDRAFQIANSEPQGPVYMAFPRETLMSEVEDGGLIGPARIRSVRQGTLSLDEAEAIVERLIAARNPLLVTAYVGRTPELRRAFVELAELTGAGITEYRGRFNAPLEHPQHLGFNPEQEVVDADLMLVVDHDVPFVPADLKLQDDVHIIHIGNDPIMQRWTTWGFPSDTVHSVNVGRALDALIAVARTRQDDPRIAARKAALAARHDKMVADRDQRRAAALSGGAISPMEVGAILARVAPEAMVIEEAVTSGNPFAYGFTPGEEGSYFRNGGSYLGWALGASFGARLGDPDQLVVTVVGDGAFMFGAPTPALWAARQNGVPLLVIVLNNESYNSVVLASRQDFPNGAQEQFGHVGSLLPQSPAFETLAEACGAFGRRVTRMEDVEPALLEALAAVRSGRSAVLNIMTEASRRPL